MFLDWKYVKDDEARMLEACRTQEDVRRYKFCVLVGLNRIFFPQTKCNQQNFFIELNFHVQNYSFCKSSAFDIRKTSTFLSMMKEVLDLDIGTEAIHRSPAKSIARLEGFIVAHSVERPPKSVQIFNRTDVAAIMNFCLNRYYRNFHLFNYVFGTQISLKLTQILRNEVDEPCQSFMALSNAEYKEVPTAAE